MFAGLSFDFAQPGVSSVPETLLDAFTTTFGEGASNSLWEDLGFLEHYVDDVFLLTGDSSSPMTINNENPSNSRGANGAADLVIGTNNSETIAGSDGDEIFFTGAGADSVAAGGGDDIVIAGGGDTTISGGEGNDFLMGDSSATPEIQETGHDLIVGGEGNDTIYGMFGNDVIYGNLQDFDVFNDAYDNLIFGGIGDDTIYDGVGNDEAYGEAGEDTYIHYLELVSLDPPEEGEEGFEAFEGPTGDLLFGGDDTDTLVLSEGGEIRAGLVEGELVFAISRDNAKTDLAFQFEHIEGNGATLDLSGYNGDVTIDWTAMTIEIEGKTITFDGLSSIFPGSGDTTIIGDQARWLRSGDGDDELFSGGGNIRISGGAGQNILHAQFGDEITGDADDTLILNGVTITGEDIMFGTGGIYRDEYVDDNTTYPATRGTERLLEIDYAIMVEPLPIQVEADGTWSSIKWQGYIVFSPDLNTHFDQDGKFIKATADANIIFNMGDFGINTSGPFMDASIGDSYNARNLFENNEYIDFGLGPGDAPVGRPGIDGPEPPVDFYDYTGLTQADIYRILDAFSEAGIQVDPILIEGTTGDDILVGGIGNDTLFADGGDDILTGGFGDDFITSGEGSDTIVLTSGSGYDAVTDFDVAKDKISFGGENLDPTNLPSSLKISQLGTDLFFEDKDVPGAFLVLEYVLLEDWLAGSTSDGIISGTAGDDFIDAGYSDADRDVLNDSGQLIETGDGYNVVYDGAGNDTVIGGVVGTDVFFAGAGSDHYDGITNHKSTLHYTTAMEGLVLNLPDTSQSSGIAQGDSYANLEWLNGSDFADTITTGNGAIRKLSAGAGDDIIIDGGGQAVWGGAGNDTFVFAKHFAGNLTINDFTQGQDKLDVSGWGVTSMDDLTFTSGSNRLWINFDDGTDSDYIRINGGNWFDGDGNVVLTADDFIFSTIVVPPPSGDGILSGTAGDDTIDAGYIDADGDVIDDSGQLIETGDGYNVVYDGAGNDTVIGGVTGQDHFFAGAGADHYDGITNHKSHLNYTTATEGLVLNLSDTSQSSGIAQGDSYANLEWLRGSNFADTITTGNAAVRKLSACDGDDFIIDGGGQAVWGGAGNDTFVFNDHFAGDVTINDFTQGQDKLDVSGWGVTSMDDLTFGNGNNRLWVNFDDGTDTDRIRINGGNWFDGNGDVVLTVDDFIFA